MSAITKTKIQAMTKEQNYLQGYEDGKNDMIDWIIAEISNLDCEYISDDDYCGCDAYINANDILTIISTYKSKK